MENHVVQKMNLNERIVSKEKIENTAIVWSNRNVRTWLKSLNRLKPKG
jgi:hypothetical protein